MSHPFGDRLSQHLHRKHGLSQSKLAAGILQAPAIITDMCKGRRLTGPQARERVVAIIQWLHDQAVLTTIDEANALLTAADLFPLHSSIPAEATLLQQLQKAAPKPLVAPASAMPETMRLAPRHNLPVQSTTFVGREAEQERIVTLLADPHCRLLALVGPGGVGKTRLALQAVATQVDAYEHGIWFVALAPLLTADLVAATCLEALNLGQQPHMTPDEQLLHYLRHKDLLLLLDNFEHLPAAVGLVKAILNTAPQVKLLVTTRERLKVQEEWIFPVGGLTTPAVTSLTNEAQLAAVAGSSASRLFVERALRLQPTFALTAGNAPAIAQICRTVDGIPLAIELAAGWSRLLPPAAIAQAMAQDFGFLSSAWQDLPPRHQSLAAVFGHSWRLLTDVEQEVLRQLLVFRGGFRVEAAQAVAEASLALLGELVDKSWLRVSENGRFDLHELIRQFLVHQNGLPVAEELARHSAYYATFLQSQEPFLHGPNQYEVMNTLLAEVDNIRQGWQWAVEHIEVESIGNYLNSWQWLGDVRCWYREMAYMFGKAADLLKGQLQHLPAHTASLADVQLKLTLARTLHCQARHLYGLDASAEVERVCQESIKYWPATESTASFNIELTHIKILLSDALYAQGRYAESEAIVKIAWQESSAYCDPVGLQAVFSTLSLNAYTQGRFVEAQRWLTQSLAIANQSGEQVRKLLPLMLFAEIACNQGDYEGSDQYSWEVYRGAEAFGDVSSMVGSYVHLGYAAFLQGQLVQAKQFFQHGLAMSEEINADFLRLNTRRWLGNIAYRQQEYAAAHRWFSEALTIASSVHRQNDTAIALTGLGKAACTQGNLSDAFTCFQQAIELLQKTGALPDLLDALVGISQWWLQAGALETAARLLGFVQQHPSLLPLGQQGAAQIYAQLQMMLSQEQLVAALGNGAALTVDEAVALALRERADDVEQEHYTGIVRPV